MSTTTRCLLALGMSVSLFAACGDDDDDDFGVGGSGGRAGGGGRGGTAGAAGTGGASGAAGSGGDAGASGTAGTGGTGGSTAGTGGSTAGTGGSTVEPPDAGADAAPDGGDVVVLPDGGVAELIECPADLEEAGEDAFTSTDTQEVIITRLVFVGNEIEVTFRAVVDGFAFNAPLQLCTGSRLNGDCDDGVQELEGEGVGDAGTALAEGEEVTFTTGLGDVITAAAGEIALINGHPAIDADPIIRAYVNWGGYVSVAATEGPNDGESLEEAAVTEGLEGVWSDGDSVVVNGQTTIYADGDDVTTADGFDACTQD